jgi:thiol-disulfide isomerase/thioredoxin
MTVIISSLSITSCRSTKETQTTQSDQTQVEKEQLLSTKLKTVSSSTFSFQQIQNNLATVFVFVSPECPIAQKYTLEIEKLSGKYKEHKIEFYGIFPGMIAMRPSCETFADDYNLTIPLLKDGYYKVTKLLGATITPEVFVLDSNASILYSGQIDNWFFRLGKRRTVITERYLLDAIEAIINSEMIKVKQTEAVGCFIEQ